MQLSRRALVVGAAAVGAGVIAVAGAAEPAHTPGVPLADTALTLSQVAALHVNLETSEARTATGPVRFTDAASGSSMVRPAARNLLGAMLPFRGGSLGKNQLPAGLEWHGHAAKTTLLALSDNRFVYQGETTALSANFYGGVRTTAEVVAPGQTVLLSFKADMSAIVGDVNASIRVSLMRLGDDTAGVEQLATFAPRVYNAQESQGALCTARLTAPSGGSRGYRLVINVQAAAYKGGQRCTIEISSLMLVSQPQSTPTIGQRYAIPAYAQQSVPASNLILRPAAPAGRYHVVYRTAEFGWAAETVTLDGPSGVVDFSRMLGATANVTVREAYVVPSAKWTRGWMNQLAPVTKWTPVRYMEIGGLAATSRPESPNRLSRMTGLVAGLSAVGSDTGGVSPALSAPAETWAVSYNPDRLSHQAFVADKGWYLGDVRNSTAVRSEIAAGSSVAFDRPIWTSFSVRTPSTLTDTAEDRYAVILQYRYVRAALGDTSQLSPDLAFEQHPNNIFRLRYRSDNGIPVMADNARNAALSGGVATGSAAEFSYVPGTWYSVVLRSTFSARGGGSLAFWLDGVKLFDRAVPLGYSRPTGPQLRYGCYKYSDSASTIEYQHMEHGERDLSSRIEAPLPI